MNIRTALPAAAFLLTLPFLAACGGGGAASKAAAPALDVRPATEVTSAGATPTPSPTAQAAVAQIAATQAASTPDPVSTTAAAEPTAAPATTAAAEPTAAAATTTAASPTPAPAPAPVMFTLSMRDETFSPTSLAVRANQAVTVIQRNDGKEIHNWALCQSTACDQFVVEGDLLAGGKQGQSDFTIAQPGTYKYVCEVHAKTMFGTIVVT